MNTGAAFFAVVAVVVAISDWLAVAHQRVVQEQLAKPAVMLVLGTAVAVLGDHWSRWLVVGALALSLIGDVFLLPLLDRFVAGLGAFLVAHLLYVVAFASTLRDGNDLGLALAGLAVSLALLATAGVRIVHAARQSDPELGNPVALYVGVLGLLVTAGWATGAAAAAIGATVFALSDAALGWNRFVEPLPHGRLMTHVLYHVGQGWLSVWAIGL